MAALLVLLFIVVPLLEIYVVVQVGEVLGVLPTVALLLLESLVGAVVVKREGRRAWVALREGISSGRMPSAELADAALVLVGGTLLLTPGFLTDVVGFALVLPLTRPLGRRVLGWLVTRRVSAAVARRTGVRPTPPGGPAGRGGRTGRTGSAGRRSPAGAAGTWPRPPGDVVRGEVVDDDPSPRDRRPGEPPR